MKQFISFLLLPFFVQAASATTDYIRPIQMGKQSADKASTKNIVIEDHVVYQAAPEADDIAPIPSKNRSAKYIITDIIVLKPTTKSPAAKAK